MKDLLRYDKMVENALRGVVREALARTASGGLPGAHHFYITFRTDDPGLVLAAHLREKYPNEMTVVLEHQFWDLKVEEDKFSVTLSFANRPERISVPFEAITGFADPSVKFGLQFQSGAEGEAEATKAAAPPAPKPAERKATERGEIVTLDAFRKK